ncbi:histidine kinase [Nocardioides sp. YJ-D4]
MSELDDIPGGAVILDRRQRVIEASARAAALLGYARPSEVAGVVVPLAISEPDKPGRTEDDGGLVVTWVRPDGQSRQLAYQAGPLRMDRCLVVFRDVTTILDEQRRQQHRLVAISRAAARTATRDEPQSVLQALAMEIQQVDGVAATQVMVRVPGGDRLQIMGAAGFPEDVTFFDKLHASDDRGAQLVTTQATTTGRQIVYPHRRTAMLNDERWQPMHKYISQIEWDDFVATPLKVGEDVVGVLNVYLSPGVGSATALLEFFGSMAQQAALAIDYTALIQRDRVLVRQEERRRLAFDLHDSVVQQVFSVGIQARALSKVSARLAEPHRTKVESIADEIVELSQTVQRDLRGIVLALQSSLPAERGLPAALQEVVSGVGRRSGVDIEVSADPLDAPVEFVEDVFQIACEALHNAVKHGRPQQVTVQVSILHGSRVQIDVTDDGHGFVATEARRGFGITSMRERAGRWGGSIELSPRDGEPGTRVSAVLQAPCPLQGGRP